MNAEKRFQLWREDDNGNRFLITIYERRRDAEQRLQELQKGGHKQLYWIVDDQDR